MDRDILKEKVRLKVELFAEKKEIRDDENLLDSQVGILVNNWLYILDELETDLNVKVCDMFQNMECTEFTINGITDHILQLIQ